MEHLHTKISHVDTFSATAITLLDDAIRTRGNFRSCPTYKRFKPLMTSLFRLATTSGWPCQVPFLHHRKFGFHIQAYYQGLAYVVPAPIIIYAFRPHRLSSFGQGITTTSFSGGRSPRSRLTTPIHFSIMPRKFRPEPFWCAGYLWNHAGHNILPGFPKSSLHCSHQSWGWWMMGLFSDCYIRKRAFWCCLSALSVT